MSLFPWDKKDEGLKRGAEKFGGKPDTVRDTQRKIGERINAASMACPQCGDPAKPIEGGFSDQQRWKCPEGHVFATSLNNGLVPDAPEPYGAGKGAAETAQAPGEGMPPTQGAGNLRENSQYGLCKECHHSLMKTPEGGFVCNEDCDCNCNHHAQTRGVDKDPKVAPFARENAWQCPLCGQEGRKSSTKQDGQIICTRCAKEVGGRENADFGPEVKAAEKKVADLKARGASNAEIVVALKELSAAQKKEMADLGISAQGLNNADHKLIIKSRNDAKAECSCGHWGYTSTGEMDDAQVQAQFKMHKDGVKNADQNVFGCSFPGCSGDARFRFKVPGREDYVFRCGEHSQKQVCDALGIRTNAAGNDNCDGNGPCTPGEVRRLPTSADPSGGAVILCRSCWAHEMEWRKERNRSLDQRNQFPILDFNRGEVYKNSTPVTVTINGADFEFTRFDDTHVLTKMVGGSGSAHAHHVGELDDATVRELQKRGFLDERRYVKNDAGAAPAGGGVDSSATGFQSGQKTTTHVRGKDERDNGFEMARCATCGHADGSHDALVGQCFAEGDYKHPNAGPMAGTHCGCHKFVRSYANSDDREQAPDNWFSTLPKVDAASLTRGTRVTCNGYLGTVQEVHGGDLAGMADVRVPGGLTTVSISELRKPFKNASDFVEMSWKCKHCGEVIPNAKQGSNFAILAQHMGKHRADVPDAMEGIPGHFDMVPKESRNSGDWTESRASVEQMIKDLEDRLAKAQGPESRSQVAHDLQYAKEQLHKFQNSSELCECGHPLQGHNRREGRFRDCREPGCKCFAGIPERKNSGPFTTADIAAAVRSALGPAAIQPIVDQLNGSSHTENDVVAALAGLHYGGDAKAAVLAKLGVRENADPDYCPKCGRELIEGTTGFCPSCRRRSNADPMIHCDQCDTLTQHSEAGQEQRKCQECGTVKTWDGSGWKAHQGPRLNAVGDAQYTWDGLTQDRRNEWLESVGKGWKGLDGNKILRTRFADLPSDVQEALKADHASWPSRQNSGRLPCPSCGGNITVLSGGEGQCNKCGAALKSDDWTKDIKVLPRENSGYSAAEPWAEATDMERGGWLETAGLDISMARLPWPDLSADAKVALQKAWDLPASINNAEPPKCPNCGKPAEVYPDGVHADCESCAIMLTYDRARDKWYPMGTKEHERRGDPRVNAADHRRLEFRDKAKAEEGMKTMESRGFEVFGPVSQDEKGMYFFYYAAKERENADTLIRKTYYFDATLNTTGGDHLMQGSVQAFDEAEARELVDEKAKKSGALGVKTCRLVPASRQNSVLPADAAAHLNAWLDSAVPADKKEAALDKILAFLDREPSYADGNHPWTEVAHHAGVWDA